MNETLFLERRKADPGKGENERAYKYENGPIFFYDPFHRSLIMPDGKEHSLHEHVSLTQLLDYIEAFGRQVQAGKKQVATLYILAGSHKRNRLDRAYFESVTAWYLENFVLDLAQGVYKKAGFSIWFYGTGKLFGEQKNLPAMREAYYKVEKSLADTFKQTSFRLCTTPAQTGKELLALSLPQGARYPCLPYDLQEVIRNNSPQGRKELFTTRAGETIERLYILDARFMYASCCDALPTGEPVREGIDEFCGKVSKPSGLIYPASPGFYRVIVIVPQSWQHIGLLRAGKGRGNKPEKAYYPYEPGYTFETWATANELSLALNNSWNVRIAERILFPHPQGDPLTTWLKKLRIRYEEYKQGGSELDMLMATYIRNVVIHTIGSFDSIYSIKKHLSPFGQKEWKGKRVHRELDGSFAIREIPGKGIAWKEDVPISGAKRVWTHPEWCATAWGRSRVKLAMTALRLPFESIIAFDTDCIYSTVYPDWIAQEDSGKPGKFRQKGEPVQNFVVPGSWAEMQTWIEERNLAKIEYFDEEESE